MAILDGFAEQRRHRQSRRDDAERQAADQRALGVAQLGDFLLQGTPVVEDGVRPFEHPLALWRKPVKTLAALDDRHAQLLFELAYAARQRRLRDVAGLGRAREV